MRVARHLIQVLFVVQEEGEDSIIPAIGTWHAALSQAFVHRTRVARSVSQSQQRPCRVTVADWDMHRMPDDTVDDAHRP